MTSGAAKGSNKAGASPRPSLDCLLPKLKDSRLSGLVPGLRETEGFLDVDPLVWACCQGTGFRERQDLSSLGSSVRSCHLSRRLRMVRELYHRFEQTYPEDSLKLAVPGQVLAPFLDRFRLIASKETTLGLCLPTQEGATSPVSMWQVAFMASWRFGLKVHVADLEKTSIKHLLPPPADDPIQVVFVEGVRRLWDPTIAERFELLVQYCYGGLIPLFLGVTLPPKAAQASPTQAKSGTSLKSAFGARIAKARNKLVASTALSADCAGKLRATTAGVEGLIDLSF
jgi:hypothetical protein